MLERYAPCERQIVQSWVEMSESKGNARTGTNVTGDSGGRLSDMPYESFLAERQRIVEARQRAQQRFDQIVSTGAAGALVLSITFLEKLAPNPDPESKPILLIAWLALLISLGANFLSHLFGQRAFDNYIREFDRAYVNRTHCDHESAASSAARWADGTSAVAFVIGVIFLAWFSVSNLPFKEDSDASVPTVQQAEAPTAETGAASTKAAPTAEADAATGTASPTPPR